LGVLRPESRPLTGDRGFAAAIVSARQALQLAGRPLGDIQADVEEACRRGDTDALYEVFQGLLAQLRAEGALRRTKTRAGDAAETMASTETGRAGRAVVDLEPDNDPAAEAVAEQSAPTSTPRSDESPICGRRTTPTGLSPHVAPSAGLIATWWFV
jgi:hypothetical protein